VQEWKLTDEKKENVKSRKNNQKNWWRKATKEPFNDAVIKPILLMAMNTLMYITKTYKDISIGRCPTIKHWESFGGDEDNWMWPRHTR